MSKDFEEVRMVSLKSVKIVIEKWKRDWELHDIDQLDALINRLPYHIMDLNASLEAMTHKDLDGD